MSTTICVLSYSKSEMLIHLSECIMNSTAATVERDFPCINNCVVTRNRLHSAKKLDCSRYDSYEV